MIGNKRLLIATLFLLAVLSSLEVAAWAFELFPRPKGQYSVQRGDTLYGIAGTYYNNPALWPFLWNQNPSARMDEKVRNPEHEPLTAGTKLDLYHVPFAYSVVNQKYLDPTGMPDDVRFLQRTTPYTGIPYDRRYFKYKLSDQPTRLWGYIASAPDPYKTHYLERDLVYVRMRPSKRQCVLVGDRFGIFREQGPLTHPLNPEAPVGYMAQVVGEIEITSTGHDLLTAVILDSYEELVVGDKLCLFVPRAAEIVPTKTHRMLVGTILRSATRNTFYTDSHNLENDVVFIDRGKCDGMKEGLLLNIYRPAHPVADPYFQGRRFSTPDRYVGEGMILKAFDKKSTVLITKTREEVVPGDTIKTVSD